MTLQNIIACCYDCDKTLIPNYMQDPLFNEYGINATEFWEQTNAWHQKIGGISLDMENAYLNLMLKYVEEEKFKDLSNAKLKELGAKIEVFPGLPDFFKRIKSAIEENPRFKSQDIRVEHYIISTGLKEMILGSPLYKGEFLNGVYASEFIEEEGKIKYIARALGHMKKTEFLHMINKGANVYPNISVNDKMSREIRRIPWENIIMVGDGPTDVPCFATLNKRGGTSFAVYNPKNPNSVQEAYELRKQDRVFDFGPADYRPDSHTSIVLEHTLKMIAERIVKKREEEIDRKTFSAPTF